MNSKTQQYIPESQGRKMGRGTGLCCNLRFDDPDRDLAAVLTQMKKQLAPLGINAPDLYRMIVKAGIESIKDKIQGFIGLNRRIQYEELTPDLFGGKK